MSRPRIIPGKAVLAGLIATAATTAEPVVRELDVAAAVLPASFSYTLDTQATGRSGSDRFREPLGLRAGLRWSTGRPGSPWAWVLGADATAEQAQLGTTGAWDSQGLAASGGLARQFGDRWALLGEVTAGLAQARLETRGPGYGDQRFAGSQQMMGARLQARWLPGRSWTVFAEAGWRSDSAMLDGDGGSSLALSRQGPVLGLGLGWRWAYEPPGLE